MIKKLNFKNHSKRNIKKIKKFYRRSQNEKYNEEIRQYNQMLSDIEALSKELNKISKGYGSRLQAETNKKLVVLSNPGSLVAKDIKKEKAKLPKNRVKTMQYVSSIRQDLASLTRKPEYSPDNVKNYVTTIAAKAAGIKTKVANRTGQIKPDFTGATPAQKKKYQQARRFVKSGKTDLILRAMGAYEKSYGVQGKVSNSNEVMENITSFVQDHETSQIDEIISEVHQQIGG